MISYYFVKNTLVTQKNLLQFDQCSLNRLITFVGRYRVPGISIATDIICGFPTETEADFEETMELCRKYKFPSLFINQYFPRPGTPAARLERLNAQVVSISI